MSAKNNGGLWVRPGLWRPMSWDMLETRCQKLFGDGWRPVVCKLLDITPRTLARWKAKNEVTNGPTAGWLMAMEDLKDAGELEAHLRQQGHEVFVGVAV
jgi:hypothetical protein